MLKMTIISIGEILWDVFPDGERLGGAPFNLAAHARRLGHDVWFISAVGDDERGRQALERMKELGLPTGYVRTVPDLPTGAVSIRLTNGQPDYTIHRPAAYDRLEAPRRSLAADWICFGTLLPMDSHSRGVVHRVIADNPGARRFYDVNLRRDSWTPELVRDLMSVSDVVKLNDEEARIIDVTGRDGVCITRGAAGCTLRLNGVTANVPGIPVLVADAVGAGDAWSAAFLHGISEGWPLDRTGAFANRLGALVASRPGAIPDWSPNEIK